MTDEQAMQAVQAGDIDQMALLFERHHSRFYRFFRRLTSHSATSEDLTQALFLRMLHYRHAFKAKQPFMPWAFKIAHNLFRDEVKKKSHQDTFIHTDSLPDSYLLSDNTADLQDERERKLHCALAKLPDQQRELLILSRFESMKYSEIGALFGLTEGAVKVRVHRAMQSLREIFFSLDQ